MSSRNFTFCVPNLNKFEYLPACIDSILAQDCETWCCVFVDGYSSDGCWEYIQTFATDPRFKILRGVGDGMYADWNVCLEHVDTEYFYFLTSDDTCAPSLVSATTSILDQYPTLNVCHFKFDFITEEGEVIHQDEDWLEKSIYRDANTYAHIRPGGFDFLMHFTYRAIYTTITSLVFRRPLIQDLQGFSSAYQSSGDFDWTMRMGLFTDVLYIPETLATWRVYQAQATRQVRRLDYHVLSLAIAQANLQLPQVRTLEEKFGIKVHKKALLKNFLDHYASFLRKQMIHASSLKEFLEYFILILHLNPLYFLRAFTKKITLNRICSDFNPLSVSKKMIDQYKIQWPPSALLDYKKSK
jgi:glycosyltransferase involved in cell wall biosynthesis